MKEKDKDKDKDGIAPENTEAPETAKKSRFRYTGPECVYIDRRLYPRRWTEAEAKEMLKTYPQLTEYFIF